MDKTLIKGVTLLEYLVHSPTPSSVSALAKALRLQPSNVHRTLQTWAELGFVAQDAASGNYHCSFKLFEWGCKVAGGFDVRRLAHEHLVKLGQSTQETIHLSVLDGADIVYLDKIDSPQPVRAYSEIGGRAPAHCVATGKALLANHGAVALERLPRPLPRLTPNTCVNLTTLKIELEKIRSCGFAINHEEWRLGVNGLGAVIFNQLGDAVAAVGLTAPASRLDERRATLLGAAVLETANQVTRALGGRSRNGSV